MTGRRRWMLGQLALYGLLTIVAYAIGALSGVIWGTIGDVTRTDELPFVAAVLALPVLVLATVTVPGLRWPTRLVALAALLTPVVAMFFLHGEALQMLVGAVGSAAWVSAILLTDIGSVSGSRRMVTAGT